MDLTSNIPCGICLKKRHQYTCPRCNIKYCDLACYKHVKHADCSEMFYRNWFLNELKNRKVSEAEKESILETIRKVEKENPIIDFLEDDREYEVPLEERLQSIDLTDLKEKNVDDLWDKLTSKEQEEFKVLAQSGFISVNKDFSEAWKPWWLFHSPHLITEIHIDKQSRSRDDLPDIINVPPFQKLIGTRLASPLIGFNLINVLYPYVFFQRLYNGCGISDFCCDFCELCILSSAVLKDNRNFDNADQAICSSFENCIKMERKHDFCVGNQFPIECMQDVCHILLGPGLDSPSKYATCLLSDLYKGLKKLRKFVKCELSKGNDCLSSFEYSGDLNKYLFCIMKKLEFLLSWCLAFTEQLPLLSIEVSELYKQRLQRLKEDIVVEQSIANKPEEIPESTNKPTKQLIEELN